MEILYIVFILIIGCIFGSFFNVVGDRLPNDMSIVHPGSHCTQCNHKLRWYELIPVFSYLFQKGKCRNCGFKISIIYPVVELATGALFVCSYVIFGFSYEFVLAIIVSSLLMIVIVSDISYLIIPDQVTIFFCLLMFVLKLIKFGIKVSTISLLSGLFLFVLMYLIMIFGNWLLKKESLGGGDVKLMFFVGIAIGPILGMFSIFLSSLIALPLSLIFYLKNENSVIPFGPFIIIAVLIIVLFQIPSSDILSIFK